MLDGVSGHAGLFGTANDLAKLMQMYLNGGSYGGEQYITSATLKKFSVCQYCQEGVRRAIGFDRPVPGHPEDGNCAKDASDNSFGHSGYTGTFTWVDPETGILFVFFSNRVYPTRNNNKISELNIRPLIHQAIYDARTDE
jgi:CubicO group peptidase (beta-lactamase class C family)